MQLEGYIRNLLGLSGRASLELFLATSAYPAPDGGRVAIYERVVGNIFRCHAPCPNESILANSQAAKDGGIGPNRGTALQVRGQKLCPVLLNFGACVRVIYLQLQPYNRAWRDARTTFPFRSRGQRHAPGTKRTKALKCCPAQRLFVPLVH